MQWVALSQEGEVPEARSSHSVTCVGNSLYLFGGEHSPRIPVSSDLFKYDLEHGRWSRVEIAAGTPPSPRVAHTATAVGTNLVVFGGRSGVEMGEGAMNDLYIFDTKSCSWRQISSDECKGSPPPKRSFHTSCAIGSKVYIFGGCGEEGRLADLHELDTESLTWRQLPSHEAIAGRGGSCLVASADGASLYVVAGFCGKELDDMYRFDLAAESWEVVPPSGLTARSVFGAAVHSCAHKGSTCDHCGHLIAFGGEVDPSAAGHAGAGSFTSDLACYDAAKGWHALSAAGTAPGPRGWFATTTWQGGLLIHGGLDVNNERLGDMHCLKVQGC